MRYLATLFVAFAASAAPPALVWSATDHSAQAGTSGQTVTRVGVPFGHTWDSARSDTPQTAGVRTITFRVNEIGPTGVQVGLANGKESITAQIGSDSNGLAYRQNGNVLKGNAWVGVVPLPPTFTTGDVLGMQVDFGVRTVRFSANASAWSGAIDFTSLGQHVFVTASVGSSPTGAPVSSLTVVSDDWNDFQAPTLNLIFHGDSLTLDGNVDEPYGPRLAELILANRTGWASWTKAGINGASWNFAWSQAGYPYTLTQDIAQRVIPALSASIPNWVIAWAGTNGFALGFHSVATEYASLQADVNALIAAGVPANHIIVPTMLPRTGLSETTRTAYNAAIVADAGAIGYKVARFDMDPTYGQVGDNADPAKYPDGVHPIDAAHVIFAQTIYGVMYP